MIIIVVKTSMLIDNGDGDDDDDDPGADVNEHLIFPTTLPSAVQNADIGTVMDKNIYSVCPNEKCFDVGEQNCNSTGEDCPMEDKSGLHTKNFNSSLLPHG